jgi:hypothetical protein
LFYGYSDVLPEKDRMKYKSKKLFSRTNKSHKGYVSVLNKVFGILNKGIIIIFVALNKKKPLIAAFSKGSCLYLSHRVIASSIIAFTYPALQNHFSFIF